MAFWFSFFLWLGTYVLADFFRQRLPEVKPAGLGDFDIPTATEGRHVPIMVGRLRVGGPNVTWYGDYSATERTVKTGVIFKRRETIGYTYHLALQLTQLRGRVAGMTGIWIGDTKVWDADEHNGGAPAVVVDVDRPDLFGGGDQGGGFVGRLRCHTGADDQAPSAFLQGRQDPLPAYRGYTYVMVTDLLEQGGANIGESPSLRDIRIEFQAYDTVANGGLGDSLGLGDDHHIVGKNLNPIVAAFEVFTNTDWGRALPSSDVDIDNFKAAAQTCFGEGLGFSILIDTPTDAADIIDNIEQHIDGYIGPNPVTGLLEVTLARQDYVLANEFQANADNVKSVSKFSRGEWPQTFNKILVKYADRTKHYKDTYAPAQDMANRLIQGRVKAKTISFPGVHDADVANKMAWRTIRTLAQPLASATVELDRSAYPLRPGRIMSLTDEDIGVENLPVRVTSISPGDPLEGTIIVDCVEDVFGAETTGFVDPPATDFGPVVQPVEPLAAEDQAAVEAPYVVMQYDEQPDTVPRLLTFARATSGRPNEYEVVRRIRPVFGTGVYGPFGSSEVVRAGFMAVGVLRDALGGWEAGNGTFSLSVDPVEGSLASLVDNYSPGADNAAGIAVLSPGTDSEEWLVFSTVVADGGGVQLQSVWRACCDTGMVAHAAGARMWFVWTGGLGLPLETYVPGSGVEAKFLPRSPTGSVAEVDAVALAEAEMRDPPRHRRPLMPRTLLLNGSEFPAFASADALLPSEEFGFEVSVGLRSWRVADILKSVRGLNANGTPISDADVTVDDVSLEYWLYNLDATPTPTRADAISTATVAVSEAQPTFEILRNDLAAGGVTADFVARLEIEVRHSPPGETADQPSIRPFFFDFGVTGNFAGVDPLFGQVLALIGVEGTAVEEIGVATLSLTGAGTQVSSTQAKFGNDSLACPGNAQNSHGVRMQAPDDYFVFPGEFTLEGWFYPTALRNFSSLFDGQRNFGSAGTWTVQLTSNGTIVVLINGSPTIPSSAGALVANAWQHVAISRDTSNVVRIFVDGVLRGSGTKTGTVGIADSGLSHLNISRGIAADNWSFNGFFEEIRVTDVCRYTADFTPPSGPFLRQ